MAVIVFALLGLVVLAGTLAAYHWLGGFGSPFSHHVSDWANFGTYVGGVAGPLLSFLALIAVVWTLRLQYALLERDRERQMADRHVRWLEAVYKDMQDVLHAPLVTTLGAGAVTSIHAVLTKEVDVKAVNSVFFKTRIAELMGLLSQYCEAVALYRDNITAYFDLKIFVDRGARVLDLIKPFNAALGTMSPITIEFCDMHLRGERSRKEPEAMKRRTRRS
ncbi:hypothetical protein HDE76_004146 [Rhodanobacter sp. ANJX3]|uniref:hypothetical protein n=1 Tax=Rhodanobacter sp. ANJX3 TaxID=2723083 RepID=UPI00160DCD14|nr:hypothetical protein [Rhodanobacter sp. ANJX3]MBB5360894.1 hypothetical protein [Rhodanobacter sp. ANJX3]